MLCQGIQDHAIVELEETIEIIEVSDFAVRLIENNYNYYIS
jgi:hypothetical protein